MAVRSLLLRESRGSRRLQILSPVLIALLMPAGAGPLRAQPCPEEPSLQNYTGGGQVVCPCFIGGEEAGAVFNAPAGDYPIEILRVGIGWASQFGGAPQSLEQGIHVYGAGLPNPGARLYTLPGPVLNDGAINVYNLAAQLGTVTVNGGPFSVTLEFMNNNAGDIFAPSVVHDGNGCQSGKNLVKANPGGWLNACTAGISGDWVFFVVYRRANCGPTGIGDEEILASRPVFLLGPHPNPTRAGSTIEFVLREPGDVRLSVFDVAGREVSVLADRAYAAGQHRVDWSGPGIDGGSRAPGVYFVRLEVGGFVETRKIVVSP